MNPRPANMPACRASVLIIVLWVAFGLISLTLYFAHAMLMDLKAADNRTANLEADQAIEGAALYVSNVLANRVNMMTIPSVGNFRAEGVKVGDAKFWLIGRDTNDLQSSSQSDTPFWGLVDEAAKVNLNHTDESNFLNLPQMTFNTSAAMSDWASASNTPSNGGAKSETYSTLQPPYLCKNAPYDTIDELRLVYGMDLDLLYGEDANLNGILDPNENDGMKLPPYDNQDGILDPGLFEYVTTWSYESSIGTNGTARVAVSDTNGLRQLFQTNFPNLVQNLPPGISTSVLDFYYRAHLAGMAESDFQQVEPFLMNPTNTGLININTATATVLCCIPGIGSNMAPQVLAYRQSNPPLVPSVTWLVTALNNDQSSIEAAGPYVTPYSFQFAADVVAVGHQNRGYRRVRFVFDCGSGTPLIVYRQDLTNLGWPLGKKLHDQLLAQNSK